MLRRHHGSGPAWLLAVTARDIAPACCATVEFQPLSISIDAFLGDAFPADVWECLCPRAASSRRPPPKRPCRRRRARHRTGRRLDGQFRPCLQVQHTRVREFLQAQRDRWRQIAARFTGQIETLQAEVRALQAVNEGLRAEILSWSAEGDPAEAARCSRRYLTAMDDIRDLKGRNAELQRQLLEIQSRSVRQGAARPPRTRRRLGNPETPFPGEIGMRRSARRRIDRPAVEDRRDRGPHRQDHRRKESRDRRTPAIAQTTRATTSARRRQTLRPWNKRSTRTRSSARSGKRLQQLQDECRDKLRQAEIELAMERARLARRDAEIEEKLRNADRTDHASRGRGPGADRPAGPRPLADAVGPDRRRPAGVRSQPRPAVKEGARATLACRLPFLRGPLLPAPAGVRLAAWHARRRSWFFSRP